MQRMILLNNLLKNKYRDAEKEKVQEPEQGPLDQPPQRLPFFLVCAPIVNSSASFKAHGTVNSHSGGLSHIWQRGHYPLRPLRQHKDVRFE
jgi:hypothetical protein